MKKVYIAASFAYEEYKKTSQRKAEIEKIASKLKAVFNDDVELYLPHLLKIPNAWDISLEEWSMAVYNKDMSALREADLVIFISYGKENNSGSVWEIGWVCGHNEAVKNTIVDDCQIPIVMIKMTEDPESLMLFGSIQRIITEDEIETYNWEKLPVYKTKIAKLS